MNNPAGQNYSKIKVSNQKIFDFYVMWIQAAENHFIER